MSVPPSHPHLSSTTYRDDRAAIITALDAARTTHRYDSAEITAAVRQCAENARRGELPPETMIVALKSLIEHVALSDMGRWFREVVRNRVVVSAIEAYYGVDATTGGAPADRATTDR